MITQLIHASRRGARGGHRVRGRISGWLSCLRYLIAFGLLSPGLLSQALADGGGAIPTPSDDTDPTQHDFVHIGGTLLHEICGYLLYGTAIFFICFAAFEVYRGYCQYREKDDFGKMKGSLLVGLILVSVGLSAFFAGQHVLTNWTIS